MKREEELDRIGVRPASGRVGRCRKLEVEPGLNRFNLEQNSVRLERSARMVQKMRPFTGSSSPFISLFLLPASILSLVHRFFFFF